MHYSMPIHPLFILKSCLKITVDVNVEMNPLFFCKMLDIVFQEQLSFSTLFISSYSVVLAASIVRRQARRQARRQC